MRQVFLPALLGIALLSGCAVGLSELWQMPTDPHFSFVSWADSKGGYQVLSGLSDQATQLSPAFTIYPGDLLPRGFTQDAMNRWKEAMDGGNTGDTSPNGMFDIAFPVRGNHDRGDALGWQAYFDFQATADQIGATHFINMPESGFVTVDVKGPRVTVTFYQLGSMDPVNTIRFVKGR